MKYYVFCFFLPGSAGNFFTRCLSLAGEEYYGLVEKNNNNLNLTVDQKFEIFRYKSVASGFGDWIEFERKLEPHHSIIEHSQLPEGSVSIWFQHPNPNILRQNIAGSNDRQIVVYIDPTNAFEWTILNALWKNSFLAVEWFRGGKKFLQDESVHKVPLESIVSSSETLIHEVEKITSMLGKSLNDHSKQLISDLWHEWQKTILKPEDFESFKQSIGFRL